MIVVDKQLLVQASLQLQLHGEIETAMQLNILIAKREPDNLIDLIKTTPNDADLGAKLREYYGSN